MGTCVVIKSFKYSTLDPTKEMAYLPLSKEQKNKAKAIVDVVGARAGKSIGSLFDIVLTSCAGLEGKSLTKVFFAISFTFFALCIVTWIFSAIYLNGYIIQREQKNK